MYMRKFLTKNLKKYNQMKMKTKENSIEISVVMSAYNAKKHIKEAIDSIINQSFTNFECIIVDDGSTDSTKEIIRSYVDDRIVLVENNHDYIGSLNRGIQMAKGKYIARMDADDIMHPNRLNIQYKIMETEPSITVCATWMNIIKENTPTRIYGVDSGLIDFPILMFLKRCFISNPSTMIRADFLRKHRVKYKQQYIYAEDYQFWVEIAMYGGVFYIESQPLLSYRLSPSQVSQEMNVQQQLVSIDIRNELLDYIIHKNLKKHPEMSTILKEMRKLERQNIISNRSILDFFHLLFNSNKMTLQF